MDYIKVDESFQAIVIIPESVSTDTVTYSITLGSDKSVFATGSMTFVAGHAWKCSFTPTSEDDYILEANDATLIIKHTEVFKATGSGITAPTTPSGNDLTTTAAFKTAFNITTASHNTMIQNIITEMSEQIQGHPKIDQYFKAANYTEYYNGDGTQFLVLRKIPINSITSIHDDIDRAYGADTLIDSDDYSFDADSGIVEFDLDYMTKGVKNVKVIYNAGYATIPSDVKMACEKLVFAEYIERVGGVNIAESDMLIYRPDKLRKEAWKQLEVYFK